VHSLLGANFDLKIEHATTALRMPSGKAACDIFVEGYGPTKGAALIHRSQGRA